jgi:hypothetical protein
VSGIEKSGYPTGQSTTSPSADRSGSGSQQASQDVHASRGAVPESISSMGVSGLGALKASME